MHKIKSIHFVGIKGVGMTPLAIIAKEAGLKVTGSDIADEFITDLPLAKVGIKPLIGFSKENVGEVDLVITTGAHGGLENEEVKEALNKNIKVITQGEAVGLFMQGEIFHKKYTGVSVAGSHGKTTTTAMLATLLKESGLDPSFVIGTGDIPSLGGPGHFGKGKYFIAEADEYATEPNFDKTPKFMWQHPKIAIFTNIELDHPDLYKDVDEIRDAFLKFALELPKNGQLIVNGDDFQTKKLLKSFEGNIITYGFSPNNDYVLQKVNISSDHMFFWVENKGVSFGEFMIQVVGTHNALNALASIIAALELGLNIDVVRKSLKKFSGTKRRFEFVGTLQYGALLFDDYAHHPTEIQSTLKAFRQNFPKAKIVCIFQPHTFSRTKKLFEQFLHSFIDANEVIISNIYPSQREVPDPSVSSKMLVENMVGFNKNALFLPDLANVIEYIKHKQYDRNTVVITMGAGDIYKISNALL